MLLIVTSVVRRTRLRIDGVLAPSHSPLLLCPLPCHLNAKAAPIHPISRPKAHPKPCTAICQCLWNTWGFRRWCLIWKARYVLLDRIGQQNKLSEKFITFGITEKISPMNADERGQESYVLIYMKKMLKLIILLWWKRRFQIFFNIPIDTDFQTRQTSIDLSFEVKKALFWIAPQCSYLDSLLQPNPRIVSISNAICEREYAHSWWSHWWFEWSTFIDNRFIALLSAWRRHFVYYVDYCHELEEFNLLSHEDQLILARKRIINHFWSVQTTSCPCVNRCKYLGSFMHIIPTKMGRIVSASLTDNITHLSEEIQS